MEHVLDKEKRGGVANAAPRGSNQSGMRAYNERLVLTLIRQSGPMAKANIARLTGLSAQTVSVIMRSLEADGLLEKGEPMRGKVGQPSVPMGLAREGAFFLGLKVGRRSLELVLTDFRGRVEHRVRLGCNFPSPASVVRFANDAIGQLLGRLPADHRLRVAGLGIALPFRLWDWPDTIGVAAEMESWRTHDIAQEIGESWDFPVFSCNDASAACGAELVFGDPKKPRDFLYVFVGFFIGGGLVLDNALFTGPGGNAAALGSVPVVTGDNKVCQLVDVASLSTLETALVAQDGRAEMIWESPDSWSLPDEVLSGWLDRASNGIAQAVLSSVCLIDVECVLIDGWMPSAVRKELVARIRRHLEHIALVGIDAPEVREGTIGSDARSLGAASLPLSERFLVDRKTFLKG